MIPRHALRQAAKSIARHPSQASWKQVHLERRLNNVTVSRYTERCTPFYLSACKRCASTTSSGTTPGSPSPTESSESQSTSATASDSSSSPSVYEESQNQDDRFSTAASEELLNAPSTAPQSIGKIDRRLSITFTCTVPNCGHRSSHEFSRHAYEKGIVLVQCPGCHSRHLIADHIGWFDSDDLTQGGKYKTIEELLASKGEKVSRASVLPDGTIEVDVED